MKAKAEAPLKSPLLTVTRTGFILALALLAGCASRGARVDCDGRLEPINAPASAKHPAGGPSSPAKEGGRPTATSGLRALR